MTLTDLYWREDYWLWLILLPALLVLFNEWQQKKRWQHIGDSHLLPWLKIEKQSRNKRIILVFFYLGWALLSIAIAGPRTINWMPPESRPNPDRLVVIVDLSASMNARDLRPDRRRTAISQVKNWLTIKPDSLEVSLVVFAGHAFELMIASADAEVINHFLDSLLDIHLPTLGNDFAAALALAQLQLKSAAGEKYLMILTDGDIEVSEQQKALALINDGLLHGVNTTIIGLGGEQLVDVPGTDGNLIQHQNRPVLSKLEDTWLRRLAQSSAQNQVVQYSSFTRAKDQNLKTLLSFSVSRIDPSQRQNVIWNEWFQWPLVSGLLLIFCSLLFEGRAKANIVVGLFCVLLISGVFYPYPVLADATASFSPSSLSPARLALHNEDYESAKKLFNQQDSYQASFGEGIACYRLKNFECARSAFATAAWQAQKPIQRARAVFNLGNSYFHLAEYDQAAVLFRDAGLLGLTPDIVQTNLSYARSMKLALQRHIEDIQETFRRAKFKASAAGDLPPSLQNVLANSRGLINLKTSHQNGQGLFQIQTHILHQKLSQALGLSQKAGSTSRNRWVKTDSLQAQNTAEMLNRLLEMELGIPARLKQPELVKGKRPW